MRSDLSTRRRWHPRPSRWSPSRSSRRPRRFGGSAAERTDCASGGRPSAPRVATAFPGSGQPRPAADELRRLRADVERPDRERDGLKQAPAFVAAPSKRSSPGLTDQAGSAAARPRTPPIFPSGPRQGLFRETARRSYLRGCDFPKTGPARSPPARHRAGRNRRASRHFRRPSRGSSVSVSSDDPSGSDAARSGRPAGRGSATHRRAGLRQAARRRPPGRPGPVGPAPVGPSSARNPRTARRETPRNARTDPAVAAPSPSDTVCWEFADARSRGRTSHPCHAGFGDERGHARGRIDIPTPIRSPSTGGSQWP